MAESYQHYRNSFHVAWTATDIPRLATELYEQTIPDVHLSLLGYWILERDEHYNYAKRYIRELGLDQVSLSTYVKHSVLRLTITARAIKLIGLEISSCVSYFRIHTSRAQSG